MSMNDGIWIWVEGVYLRDFFDFFSVFIFLVKLEMWLLVECEEVGGGIGDMRREELVWMNFNCIF